MNYVGITCIIYPKAERIFTILTEISLEILRLEIWLVGGLWRGLSRKQNSCCPWGYTPEIQAVEGQRKDKSRIYSKFGAHLSLFERARKWWGGE